MIPNTALYPFRIHGGEYGNLTAIEQSRDIPHPIRRVYYIYDVAEGVRRGFHAHTLLEQTLICVSGSVSIELRMLGNMTDTFIRDITAMAGVANLERTGERSVKFGFTGTDEQQADIVDLVYAHKMRLLCMNETGADLESLYMKLTEESEVNIR